MIYRPAESPSGLPINIPSRIHGLHFELDDVSSVWQNTAQEPSRLQMIVVLFKETMARTREPFDVGGPETVLYRRSHRQNRQEIRPQGSQSENPRIRESEVL